MRYIITHIFYYSWFVLCLFISCQKNTNSSHNVDTKHIAESNSPFLDSLKNGLYYNSDEGEYYRFHNGKYIFDTTYVEESRTIHDVLYMSVGDVLIENDFDNDGVDDALVTLTANGGGSGIFVAVVVMLNKNSTPIYSDSKWLGDRISIDSSAMVGDSIFVYSIIQGPDEPMCCPTMPYIFKLLYHENKLQLLNDPRR